MAAVRAALMRVARTPVLRSAQLRPMVAPVAPRAFTTFVSVETTPRDAVLERLTAFEAEVLGSNWGDYFNIIQDGPFWDAELEQLEHFAQPYLSDPEIGAKMQEVHKMMDCMEAVTDCRDFLNELGELCTRASGFMGTGFNPGEKVENLEELAEHCANFYQEMLVKYPEYKPKVEQVVGHGLAVLRQKGKFRFSTMHRYMY